MRRPRIILKIGLMAIFATMGSVACAQDTRYTINLALGTIVDAADSICSAPASPLRGVLSISPQASNKLDFTISRVASLDIPGTLELKNERYKVALRNDVAGILTEAPNPTTCRQNVLQVLVTNMVPSLPRIIHETGRTALLEPGGEDLGYGLYSYAILASDSHRSSLLLEEIFKSIPALRDTAAERQQINVLYIPMLKEKQVDFEHLVQSSNSAAGQLASTVSNSLYDYKSARAMLNHICNSPPSDMLDLCSGDLSRGPFIFTYTGPASSLEILPPPYLFVDLSDVHENAFPEFIAAFRAQVKSKDISDKARIDTVRLRVLSIILRAADWISPVQKAIGDIVKSPWK